jgi:ubiquinone/menaquinone biosynthesis C-methylase UbiE
MSEVFKGIGKEQNGVIYLQDAGSSGDLNRFEDLYTKVRGWEGRIYPDEIVKDLPDTPKGHPLEREWKMRSISAGRFIHYAVRHFPDARVLELGCGNGWFSNKIKSANPGFDVYGMDINSTELEQAARVFAGRGIRFLYGDIFNDVLNERSFDLIVLNSTLQYFPYVKKLLRQLYPLLRTGGEIHVLDTPFYGDHRKAFKASRRSAGYYKEIGVPEMASHYFHHAYQDILQRNYSKLYDPVSFATRLSRFFGLPAVPFPWLMFRA